MEKKTNTMSVVSLVFAILGLVGVVLLGWMTFGFSGVFAVVGLILAIIAKKKDSEDKLAKAAFIVSLIGVILSVVVGVGCIAIGGAILVPSMNDYIEKSQELSGYISLLTL